MKRLSAGYLTVAVLISAGALCCGCSGNGASLNPDCERLRNMNALYVPMQTASLRSLDEALAKKGAGNVMASDFKPQYYYAEAMLDGKQGKTLIAYSSEKLVPDKRLFQPMMVSQCISVALDDKATAGLTVDPEIKNRTFVLSRSELASVLKTLEGQ